MIRINLLPFRAARRKENIRRQVSVFVLLLIFFILALFYYNLLMNNTIARKRSEIKSVKKQIVLYKKKVNKVSSIKKKLKIMQQKFDIIKSLQAERRKPVELLDKMTGIIVPKRMWLTSLKTDNKNVKITGIAFDNKTVADFMTRLENSSLFSNVDLKNIRMKKIDKTIQMKAFEVLCRKMVVKNKKPIKKVKK